MDNDGLLNSQETADCTNGLPANATSTCATLWDSDGDGLSDGWEVSAKDAKGTDATKADTDGDGLTDYYELTAGTSVVISDTDSDGLLDGEELCRIVNGQQLGGWQVAQAGNYRTCSDPLKGDYDGDHLLDGQEKRAGLSPYAPNTAPWMELSNQPSVVHNGAHVSVLKAGDPLTVTLYLNNTTAAGIVHPLTLDYATSVLVTPTVVTQTGSDGYIPPTPGETASGLSWNLSANPLYTLEAMTSTLATNVDPNITTSQVTSLLATAIYSDVVAGEQKTITETISVLVDMDAADRRSSTRRPAARPSKAQPTRSAARPATQPRGQHRSRYVSPATATTAAGRTRPARVRGAGRGRRCPPTASTRSKAAPPTMPATSRPPRPPRLSSLTTPRPRPGWSTSPAACCS